MRLEQRLAERAVEAGGRDVHRQPVEHLAQQRVAVGVRAVGGDADQHVAGVRRRRGAAARAARRRRPACRRCRTRRARRRPASRPSRRRAARSRPPRTPRPSRRRPRRRWSASILLDGDVVEEEQRPGRLHEHVVDAVVDDVGADAAVAAEPRGQLDLGADAVGRGDQHRLVHRRDRLAAERAAEAADAAQHGRCRGCARRPPSSG